ncbi:hypothetical protein [Cupriavidus sp. a3]|uniref:hypothetical protein n=1 Tax=Cupriavidus sp. a3 TaxID=3242158 RepID=UPI003D9C6311
MAGDWIKFEVSTPEKQEVLAITVDMGWDDPDLTVGKLLRVWRWFDQQTVEGNAPGVSAPLLDRIAGVTGFAKAMAKVGWLNISDAGLSLPNFGRHNGETAKSRALTAKRVAKHKANAKGNEEGNAATVTEELPREEKRREESSTTSNEVVVDSVPADDFSLDGEGKKTTRPECPHQAIIALYHEVLPMCPSIREWNGTRQVNLRTRWNEDKKRQNLDYWKRLFTYVSQSEFLTGRAKTPEGRKPFLAGLDWIVKSENFTKIREGRYHSEEAAA